MEPYIVRPAALDSSWKKKNYKYKMITKIIYLKKSQQNTKFLKANITKTSQNQNPEKETST